MDERDWQVLHYAVRTLCTVIMAASGGYVIGTLVTLWYFGIL